MTVWCFNENQNLLVFLVSLKAGGTGLNLTGADTVIHYDMWWNPAIEKQATDRVHRIGQRKSVTMYKLITLKTIEEKIYQLQKHKEGSFNLSVYWCWYKCSYEYEEYDLDMFIIEESEVAK